MRKILSLGLMPIKDVDKLAEDFRKEGYEVEVLKDMDDGNRYYLMLTSPVYIMREVEEKK